MTDTFIAFTETRKKQIDHMRTRLITERPTMTTHWYWKEISYRVHPLGLIDYVVYAALRGADYRKGDHTGGEVATAVLEQMVKSYKKYKVWPANIVPSDSTIADVDALMESIEGELVKWKDAPNLEHPQHVPAKPIGNFFDVLRGEAK